MIFFVLKSVGKHASACSTEYIKFFDLLEALYVFISGSAKRHEVSRVLSFICHIRQLLVSSTEKKATHRVRVILFSQLLLSEKNETHT